MTDGPEDRGDDTRDTSDLLDGPHRADDLSRDARRLVESARRTGHLPLHELGVERGRELLADIAASGRPEPVGTIEDRSIPGVEGEIDARLYYPDDAERDGLPALVYYHGGGWALGASTRPTLSDKAGVYTGRDPN